MKKRELRWYWATWASIQFLDEVPTNWKNMIEYLKWEIIIRPQFQNKYKTPKEVKAYNDWIRYAMQFIASYSTQLKDRF